MTLKAGKFATCDFYLQDEAKTPIASAVEMECNNKGGGGLRLRGQVWFNPGDFSGSRISMSGNEVKLIGNKSVVFTDLKLAVWTPIPDSTKLDCAFQDWPPGARDQPPTQESGYWSIANYVGQGFNVYGAYGMSSATGLLFNYPDDSVHTFQLQGKTLSIPTAILGVDDPSSYSTHASGSTRESYQDSLATSANIQTGIGAFSGDVHASFSTTETSGSDFAFNKLTYISQLGHLELRVDPANLTDSLKASIAALPDRVDPNNLQPFAAFFQQHGVFYIWRIVFGGSLDMYTAVAKSSGLNTQDIEVEVEASYGALFKAGAKVAASEKRETFKQNASSWVRASGGDLSLVAQLGMADAESASPDSVKLFTDWVKSVTVSPAPVDFKLKGIWELCGSKRNAVQNAWAVYAQVMHPKLTIQTYGAPSQNPPIITLGRQLKPVGQAFTPGNGWQIVILDRSNILNDSGLKFNRYYSLPPHNLNNNRISNAYDAMYAEVKGSGYADSDHLLIAVSYGLEQNWGPTGDFFGLLHACGGSTRNLNLVKPSEIGSGFPNDWTDYILVGAFDSGTGMGVDYAVSMMCAADRPDVPRQQNPVVEVLFYRNGGDEPYTFALGSAH
jgi:hypothetical protein